MPNPAPLKLDEALSPAWLSWALSQANGPVDITAVEVLEELGPSATKVRFKVTYGANRPDGLPDQYCLKGVFKPELLGEYLKQGTQVNEIGFFRDCAPVMDLNVPRCLYAGLDEETLAGIIIMEDMIPIGGKFLTAMSAYTADQAAGSVDQIARLHGASWGDAKLNPFPWAKPRMAQLASLPWLEPAKLTDLLKGPRGDALPDAFRDGGRVLASMKALAERDEKHERCLVHGDAHAGNVFQHGDKIGLIDWQVLQRANWSLDLAYHVGAALDVEDRRANEQDLLRFYLDRVKQYGGNPPAWDEAWALYRQSVAYGFFMWAITLRVDPPIIERFCTRLGTAVVDGGGWDLLGV
ncbi:phosphotransferase [Sphingomonas montanisoli]|uniref:Phosphotransferase n=1 Tax=Sphingomonas montanisoli TaxID=2606412 RepID=A0A5D9C7J1_9SPHN|nr:phosphotransferase [Sphingomonas montanisoli]TZG27386.1 phosphotransferase [Sphingomonas montanisoli]